MMQDLFDRDADAFDIIAGRKLEGEVTAVLKASGRDFVTERVDRIELGFGGIAGDVHEGMTRRSSSREPWYPRRTEIRNERQISLVSTPELALIAERMQLDEIQPEWLGANLVLDGVPNLTMLPRGTQIFFEGGVVVKIDGLNTPCKIAGKSIAASAGMEDQEEGALLFPKIAQRLRGLVGWVEKPGVIVTGEAASLRLPKQWIYRV